MKILNIRHKNLRIIKLIKSFLPENKKIKILDIGCDKGLLLWFLKIKGYNELFGIDLFNNSFFYEHKFMKANMNKDKIPFKNKFDVITCTEVIEHLENPYNLINQVYDSLKDEGVFLLSRPHMSNIFNRIHFLFTGEVMRWKNNINNNNNLITEKIFEWIIKDKFIILHKQGDMTTIPLLKWKFPSTVLGGCSLFYVLKKVKK